MSVRHRDQPRTGKMPNQSGAGEIARVMLARQVDVNKLSPDRSTVTALVGSLGSGWLANVPRCRTLSSNTRRMNTLYEADVLSKFKQKRNSTPACGTQVTIVNTKLELHVSPK